MIQHNKLSKTSKLTGLMVALIFIVSLFFVAVSSLPLATASPTFGDNAFQNLWNRTDKQVANGSTARSYLWGPDPNTTGLQEDYVEAPGGKRLVQYFDKSRMEITNPSGDQKSIYYVTNGLIAKELITGQLQLGDSKFEQRASAEIGVAGDPDDNNGPTYKTLNDLLQPTSDDVGNPITKAIDRSGNKRDGTAEFGKYNLAQATFIKETGHNIAKPFWDYLNQAGPVLNQAGQQVRGRIFEPVFFATGLPITEAWWAKVKVAGEVKDVLVQAFERRVLTYPPANSAAYQVEMGNVGQHYYQWRYSSSNTGSGTTVRIYSSLPLTGSSREESLSMVNAMQLALDDFTVGTRKIGDLTIDYIPLDDATAAKGQWDADQEKANANKVANDPQTLAYIGTFNSGAAKVSLPILNQAGIAMISPANVNTCLTIFDADSGCDKSEPEVYYPSKIRNYFRLAARDNLQGKALASFVKSLGFKSIYVIDDSQIYGIGLANSFSTAAPALGLELIARNSISGWESDYKSLANTIKAQNPEAIVFGGISQQQAGRLVADIRAAGIKVPFFGGDGILDDVFIKDAGAAAEGTYATIAGALEQDLGPKAQDVLKRYRAKYGSTQAYTLFGYESMNVTLNAIKNVGKKDKAAVIQALSNIQDFEGVLGKWSFDKNGDISLSTFIVNQVKEGRWVEQSQISIRN
ncbi:MAG: branched-chain amino acid ABC transporter substrate-binding protein [Chloroflexota bacterium]